MPNDFSAKKNGHKIGVGGLCLYNDQVLLVKHKYEVSKDKWTIPGGLVEVGESLSEAIEREMFEETKVQTKTSGLLMIRHMTRTSKTHGTVSDLYLVFKLEYEAGEPNADLEEISDAKFIPLSELASHPLGELCKFILETKIGDSGLSPLSYKPNQEIWDELKALKYQIYG
ncbi:MAG: NUDIX domain-containing protein [Promethearchaeota archaeon]